MKRLGTTLLTGLAVSLLLVVPVAASSDEVGRPSSPPPSHPAAPSHPDAPSAPPVSAPPSPSHTPPQPSHPAAAPSTGSAVSEVAKGLGQAVSAAAKSGDTSAIHDAIDDHTAAVKAAAGASGDSSETADANGGNSANASDPGAEVSALAHATDGAKGTTVSALARTLGELIRSGALTLGGGGQRVSAAGDPDTSLDSGLAPGDDDDVQPGILPDVAVAQLIA